MGSYKIKWKKSALKELDNIPRKYLPKIIKAIDNLAINPFPLRAKKLVGSEKTFRIRIGDYRVIYEIDGKKLIILIIRVKHRKDAFRK